MTRMLAATPVLAVRDVEASGEWYRTHFGFDVSFVRADGDRAVFAFLRRDEVEVMLDMCRKYRRTTARGPGDWDLYVRVDDVAAVQDSLRGLLPFAGPIDKPYGCREVTVNDPDGHVIVLSQRLSGSTTLPSRPHAEEGARVLERWGGVTAAADGGLDPGSL